MNVFKFLSFEWCEIQTRKCINTIIKRSKINCIDSFLLAVLGAFWTWCKWLAKSKPQKHDPLLSVNHWTCPFLMRAPRGFFDKIKAEKLQFIIQTEWAAIFFQVSWRWKIQISSRFRVTTDVIALMCNLSKIGFHSKQ